MFIIELIHPTLLKILFTAKHFLPFFFFQMSRVKVHSVSPTWHATPDLRLTRIKDVSRGEVIIFKEVDWQATRIEAQAVDPHSKGIITQTPIRLIANQAKLRIAVKKNINGLLPFGGGVGGSSFFSFVLCSLVCLVLDTILI